VEEHEWKAVDMNMDDRVEAALAAVMKDMPPAAAFRKLKIRTIAMDD